MDFISRLLEQSSAITLSLLDRLQVDTSEQQVQIAFSVSMLAFGPAATAFLLILGKPVTDQLELPRAYSFLLQRVADKIQQDNAAAILVTLSYIICIVLSLCLLVFVTVLFSFCYCCSHLF